MDIREQFPLDRAATQRIAVEMGVRHPTYPGGGVPVVMTTDLLLDARIDGHTSLFARAVKPAAALDDPRVLEKLEIERRFWLGHGVDWGIVTERDLPAVLIANLEWLLGAWTDRDWQPDEWVAVAALDKALTGLTDATLSDFIAALAQELAVQPAEILAFIRRLLATRHWQGDLTTQLWNTELPMVRFSVSDAGAGRVRA